MSDKVRVTLVKSPIGCTKRQRDTVKALGLRKINQTVEHNNTPDVRGMLNRVDFLIKVEEVK
jgi:large subunit ribosomal protein L30